MAFYSRSTSFVLATLLLVSLATAACGGSDEDLPLVRFESGATLEVEIADSAPEIQTGLMFRSELDENRGMVFVYPQPGLYKFYMRNTYVPLSIAFLDEDRRIVAIYDMEPLSEELIGPEMPVQFTIEANQGWFERNGIEEGQTVDLSEVFERTDVAG